MGTLHTGHVRAAPRNATDREAVREQLERILADPLFRNSKRFPALLRYVVEQTLDNPSADLKERTLGVEVFGRQPNYDTNEDPIVRATAAEIRKRIAQYYQNPEHYAELRIQLHPGSYVPEFEKPGLVAPLSPPPAAEPAVQHRWTNFWPVAAAIVTMALAAIGFKLWRAPTVLDQFWAPVINSSGTVLVGIGQRSFLASAQEPGRPQNPDLPSPDLFRAPGIPTRITDMYYFGSQNVALDDARTLGRITGLLLSRGKSYHILGETSASFSDLRSGPVILIGAFNNDWTLRLTGPMRFTFERDANTFRVKDHLNPSIRNRAVNYDTPYLELTEDYAVISRVLDPTTERMVVVVAGLTGYGTLAAGEFVSTPAYMEAAMQGAPPRWQGKNVQLVIATKVIRGNSGPPRVVDRNYW
jgi:hypothetical protein